MRTLYLKVVTLTELAKNWDLNSIAMVEDKIAIGYGSYLPNSCMVRCNSKGEINWERTSIYNFDELINKTVIFK